MTRLSADQKIQPHWWSKTLSGSILGLSLAFAFASIFAWYGPGGIEPSMKTQFNMWIISPIWLLVLSFSFLFKTGKKAFLYLSAANIVAYSIFLTLRWYL
ncbi:hypothetical protein [Psychrobium sp. 1_MG-2023]|uniref:hypothetical protein n=1 Tax=Psychrobium sp. 1_MG-2023 TaxID=3062624 RepID=UPI000C33739A|nr:hypothetical protein [Psychrobium sp. 1_MG-2023]MDP2562694.1 hypothetical protein [Psychrobium sp. 1_MG-2023]PKF54793.1 hypothetical protein CW748_15330 [Alteromonadales bacterium alter-6D02]